LILTVDFRGIVEIVTGSLAFCFDRSLKPEDVKKMTNRSVTAIRSSLTIAVALLSLVSRTSFSIAADHSYVWSVQTLNENKPWDRFVGSPTPIRVEGRILTGGNGQLRLQRCDVVFTVEKIKLQNFSARDWVEIKGQFKKENGKVVFAVDELNPTSSYIEQFDHQKLKLRRASADDWVELGNWAAERANFYEDPDLTRRANEAYSTAIELEYQALKRTEMSQKRLDPEGRFALAKKMESYKLPDRRRTELIHEGLRVQWQSLQKAEPPDPKAWQEFADRLPGRLTGTTTPLKMIAPDLKETYTQDPDSAYRKASDEIRPQLHRLFYISVIRKILLFEEHPDGRDGDKIAAQIESLIPEESALAESERRKRMEFGLKNIGTVTRSEAEKLAAAYRERGQDDIVKKVLADWIMSHEMRLKGDGLTGLLQLADEYTTLLDDRQKALECLLDAAKIDPTFDELKSKLISFGYQFRDGRWVKSRIEPADSQAADSSTEIRKGMSATNLRSLLGQPRSLSRAITSRGMTEVWVFGPVGSTPLIVRLEKRSGDTEPHVTSFSGQ
jgi:hypothetical protein